MARRPTSAVLVGRLDELSVFDRLLEAGTAAGGPLLLLGGEAGVGKTRLIEELAGQAAEAGWTVLLAACVDPAVGSRPLESLRQLLAGARAALDESSAAPLAGPARDFLDLLADDAAAAGLDLGGDGGQDRPLELAAAALAHLVATHPPVLVVVEDLHWADHSTRALFALLARRLRATPTLLVGTYRSDELHRRHPLMPLLAELQRSLRPERLALDRLDRDQIERLATLVRGTALPQDTLDAVWTRSEGNPLFAEELLGAHEQDGTVPWTLREIVLARAARLDPAAARTLDAVSLEPAASPDVLASALARPVPRIAADLEAAADAGVLLRLDHRYEFRHALVREIVYDAIAPGTRPLLHGRIAAALAERHPDRLGQIATHYAAAGDQLNAFTVSIAAGRQAARLGALAEAQLHFSRALDLWDRVPSPESAARIPWSRLVYLAGAAASNSRDGPRALQLARLALERLPEDAALERSQVWRVLATWRWDAGAPGMYEAATTALRMLPPNASPAYRVPTLLGAAVAAHLVAARHEGAAYIDEAARLAAETGDRHGERFARLLRGVHAVAGGEPAALDLIRTELAAALADGPPSLAAFAHEQLVVQLRTFGHHDQVLTAGREALAFTRRHGFASRAVSVEFNIIRSLDRLGRWDDADRAARRLLDRYGRETLVDWADGLGMSWASLLIRRGAHTEARDWLDLAYPQVRDQRELRYSLGPTATAAIELAAFDGRDTRPLLEPVLAALAAAPYPAAAEPIAAAIMVEADRALAARATGPAAAALRDATSTVAGWLDRLHSSAAAEPAAGAIDDRDLWIDQAEAEAARLQRAHDPDAWLALAESARLAPRPYFEAYARFRAAEALLLRRPGARAEDRALATECLDGAAVIAAALGARFLARDVATLARRARLRIGPPAAPPPAPPDHPRDAVGLTPREAEVLALLVDGLTNGQIAQRLFITPKTASVHVSHILAKLGAATRLEAALIAERSALLAHPPTD